MENLSPEHVEDLTDLLDAKDYRESGEESEAFARRFDALTSEFLTTIDEHIGRIKLALAQRGSRTEPIGINKKELKNLRQAINELSDESWILIAEQIEMKWPDTFKVFETDLDRIQYALDQEYVRPTKVALEKAELCALLRKLHDEYIIQPIARVDLIAIICELVGVNCSCSTFRHCMDKRRFLADPYIPYQYL
jgi:hypothetical protein